MAPAFDDMINTVGILIDHRINKLRLDYTAEAEIMSVENADEGEYKVLYQSNIFSAFAGDENKKYKVGDMVYMLVPQNNFNMKKIIIGKVSKNSFSKVNTDLANFIVPNGPTINSFYYDTEGKDPINEKNWGLIAGKHDTIKIIENGDDYDASKHTSFIQSAKDNEHIEIQASFLTSFQKQMSKGTYGLKVSFYVKNAIYNENPEDKDAIGVQDFIFDIDSFNGAPYDFRNWSPQKLRFSVQKDYLLGLKSIYFFEKGFEYDTYKKENKIVKQDTNNNIFVKDIKLQFINSVNLTDNLFYLNILMPNGNNLGKKDIILNGVLYSGGEDVLNVNSAKCYWYEKDASITINHEDYDQLAGPGWKRITKNVDNVVTIDFNQLVLHQSGNSWISRDFKLVVKYKDENIITKTVTVYNSNSPYNLRLAQITGSDGHVYLQVEGIEDGSNISYSWYRRLPDGQYDIIPNAANNKIDINEFLRYSSIDFSVEIKKDGKYYCTLYKTVSNVSGEEDVVVTYIGTDMYQYDANGDITIDNAELERTLEVNITWADGKGSSSIIQWLDCEGHDIAKQTDSAIEVGFSQPQNCMMKDMWVDTENKLHYKIKPKFSRADSNNFIILKIITVDNQVFEFKKEIAFFKDGDQGTNGTTFACVIRLFNQNDQRVENGFYPLVQDSNGYYFYKNVYPKVLVYKDGEIISSGDRFDISYLWSGINVSGFENISSRDNLKNANFIITNDRTNTHILKVKVTISDKNADNVSTQIYYNYPLSVWLDGTIEDIEEVSIPSSIMYSASGTNPSFINNPVYTKINNVIFTPEDNVFNQYGALIGENLSNIWRKTDNNYYLNPPAYYIGENPTIGTGIVFDNSSYSFNYSILCYLNTYGNEAINGWDGTAIEINEDGGYILAPQIGAGGKDENNRFTGVVMGKDTTAVGTNQFGLFGYREGIQTFGLKDDGTAFFGPATDSGQININGTSATIYGGKENSFGAHSMALRLTDRTENHSTKAIEISGKTALKPVFYVTYAGDVYLKGKVEADSGYIGSWHLNEDNTLESDSGNIVLDGNTGNIKFGEWIFNNRGFYNSHHMGTGGGNLFVTTESIGSQLLDSTGQTAGDLFWKVDYKGNARFSKVLIGAPGSSKTTDVAAEITSIWSEIGDLWNELSTAISQAYSNGYSDGYAVGYDEGYAAGSDDSSSDSSDDSSSEGN